MIRIDRGTEPRGLKIAAPRRLVAAAETFNQHGAPSESLTGMLTGYGSQTTKRALFSCARCNDRGHKANYFPLRPRTASAAAPTAPLPLPPPVPIVDVSSEQALLLDPAGSEDPLDHIAWYPLNKSFDRRDWIWTPLGLTEEGSATIDILKLGELAGRMQGHVIMALLPSIEEVEQHLAAGRITEAHRRWKCFLEDNLSPSAELTAFTWNALDHLVPDHYRLQHKLAAPTRPGAR